MAKCPLSGNERCVYYFKRCWQWTSCMLHAHTFPVIKYAVFHQRMACNLFQITATSLWCCHSHCTWMHATHKVAGKRLDNRLDDRLGDFIPWRASTWGQYVKEKTESKITNDKPDTRRLYILLRHFYQIQSEGLTCEKRNKYWDVSNYILQSETKAHNTVSLEKEIKPSNFLIVFFLYCIVFY